MTLTAFHFALLTTTLALTIRRITNQEEFYQLLTYTDDVDLNQKLAEWEHLYNCNRPHGAHEGKTPYEALKSLLSFKPNLSQRV